MRLSINVKLIIAFMCVALIALILGLIGYYGISRMGHDMENIGENRIPDIQLLSTLNKERMTIRGQTLEVWVYENVSNAQNEFERIIKQRNNSWRVVDTTWENFLKIPRQSEKGRELLSKLQGEYREWRIINI